MNKDCPSHSLADQSACGLRSLDHLELITVSSDIDIALLILSS